MRTFSTVIASIIGFYMLAVLLASLIFAIQAMLIDHEPFKLKLVWIPKKGDTYLYTSLLNMLIVTWVFTHWVDRRPLISVGIALHRNTLLNFSLGFAAGVLVKAIAVFLIFYVDLGLVPRWPFLAISDSVISLLAVLSMSGISVSVEELLFRGYFMQRLSQVVGAYPSVLITAGIFGLAHYHIAGWDYALFAALLGLNLGLLVIKTRSLWPAIGMHLGFNAVLSNIALVAVPTPEFAGLRPEILTGANPISIMVLALVGFLLSTVPLRPHPRDQELWDRYVKPAPWPSRRPKAPSSPSPQSQEEQENEGV